MGKSNTSPGEAMLRQRVRRQLAQEDAKAGAGWRRPDGRPMKAATVLFFLFSVYAILITLVNELVFWSMDRSSFTLTGDQRAFFSANRWIVHLLLALFLLCFVLMCAKKRMAACLVQFAASCVLAVQLTQIDIGAYANPTRLILLYAPAFLATAASVCMVVVLARYRKREEKAVAREYNKLYARYGEAETLTDARRWDAILLAYETAVQNGEDPPKAI